MITSLQANEIDIGIGLTEGWVAGLGKQGGLAGFKLVGTYVESPLCWAISTGAEREIDNVSHLKDTKIGVSRIGRSVAESLRGETVSTDTPQWLIRDGFCPC